jgi:nucleotide-binding universal stress UspA family protein
VKRILHPSDFSTASRAAFAKAVAMAKANRAELVVLHVLTPAFPVVAGEGYVSPKT